MTNTTDSGFTTEGVKFFSKILISPFQFTGGFEKN